MCGRYTHLYTFAKLKDFISLVTEYVELEPRYNIAPTQLAPVLRAPQPGKLKLDKLRWGLIPAWSKDASRGAPLINARSETLASKPAFSSAYRRQRCVVPVSGFYEWHKISSGQKQAYYFSRNTEEPIWFAGLWESWQSPEKDVLESFTIVTTRAGSVMNAIHERMPVMLGRDDIWTWLNLSAKPTDLEMLFYADRSVDLNMQPVSNYVNSVQNEGPKCLQAGTVQISLLD